MDIKVDDYELYSQDRLVSNYEENGRIVLILNLKKYIGKVSTNLSTPIRAKVKKVALNSILSKIEEEISNGLIKGVGDQHEGHFYVVVTGKNVENRDEVLPRIERLMWSGITKEEVKLVLDGIRAKYL